MNQPFVFGWQSDALYVQAFPVLEDDERDHPKAADALLNAAISDEMWAKVKQHGAAVDLEAVNAIVAKPRGIAMPVSKGKLTVEAFLAASRARRESFAGRRDLERQERVAGDGGRVRRDAQRRSAAQETPPAPDKKAPEKRAVAKPTTTAASWWSSGRIALTIS